MVAIHNKWQCAQLASSKANQSHRCEETLLSQHFVFRDILPQLLTSISVQGGMFFVILMQAPLFRKTIFPFAPDWFGAWFANGAKFSGDRSCELVFKYLVFDSCK
mmetsp:Transcript_31683/g.44145  ORF Transcript_31683/g.44145 Transcript_31683/m.44145 type:complete len:105 (+) Transcript_31683:262-576(+)